MDTETNYFHVPACSLTYMSGHPCITGARQSLQISNKQKQRSLSNSAKQASYHRVNI